MIWLALFIQVPLGLDLYMPVPETNPLTAEKVALGRRLFFEKKLSRDGTVACATCHDPELAFTDRNAKAVGIRGQVGQRRSPRILNRGYGKSFFWDGRVATLEQQVLEPIANPLEMDLPASEAAKRVGLTLTELSQALSSYVRTILTGDSPYDRYLAGERGALSAEQQTGLKLFRGKAGCIECHVGPNLTDERLHDTGAGEERRGFKTPSLRNVAVIGPYMHDGSLATLDDVLEHYTTKRELKLTMEEKRAVIELLKAFTGPVREGKL